MTGVNGCMVFPDTSGMTVLTSNLGVVQEGDLVVLVACRS